MRFRQRGIWAVLGILAGGHVAIAAPAVQGGVMSLGTSQTARINVVNLLPAGSAPRPDGCQLLLRFLDEGGEPILARNGRALRAAVSLPPGQAGALELPVALAPRGLFRAVIEQVNSARAPNPCAGIVITIEVYRRHERPHERARASRRARHHRRSRSAARG